MHVRHQRPRDPVRHRHTKFHGFQVEADRVPRRRPRADVRHLAHRLPPPARHRALGLRHQHRLARRRAHRRRHRRCSARAAGSTSAAASTSSPPSGSSSSSSSPSPASSGHSSAKRLSWRDIGKAVALVGVPMVLVLKQPDLGTALTYLPVLIVGLFLGGMQLKQAGIILLALLMLGGIGLATRQAPQALPAGAHRRLPQPRLRPQGLRLPDPPVAHRRRLRRHLGQGHQQGHARPRATSCPSPTPTSSSPPSARSTASSAPSASCCSTSSS